MEILMLNEETLSESEGQLIKQTEKNIKIKQMTMTITKNKFYS